MTVEKQTLKKSISREMPTFFNTNFYKIENFQLINSLTPIHQPLINFSITKSQIINFSKILKQLNKEERKQGEEITFRVNEKILATSH